MLDAMHNGHPPQYIKGPIYYYRRGDRPIWPFCTQDTFVSVIDTRIRVLSILSSFIISFGLRNGRYFIKDFEKQ